MGMLPVIPNPLACQRNTKSKCRSLRSVVHDLGVIVVTISVVSLRFSGDRSSYVITREYFASPKLVHPLDLSDTRVDKPHFSLTVPRTRNAGAAFA